MYASACSFFALQVVFIVLIGPFSFFNIQRTMILQLITIVLRNISQLLVYKCTAKYCMHFDFHGGGGGGGG